MSRAVFAAGKVSNTADTAQSAAKSAGTTAAGTKLPPEVIEARKKQLLEAIKENLDAHPMPDFAGKRVTSQSKNLLETAVNARYSNPTVTTVSPNTVRFSQKTVNGSIAMIEDMRINGWHGEPIDVVRMPDGGLTADVNAYYKIGD